MADNITEIDPEMSAKITEPTPETSEEVVKAAIEDKTEQYEGEPDKPLEDVVSISDTVAQKAVSSVVLSEAGKSDGSEMVFTVVAVDNSMTDYLQTTLNPETIPKEVQLSLVQPVSEAETSTLTASSVQVSGEQHLDQLALIAASIEEIPGQNKVPERKSPSVSMVDLERSSSRETKGKSYQEPAGKTLKGRVPCTICDQNFSDLPSMRRHRLIHSAAKPFQCDFCDKAFRRKDNLREHRNIHTQEHVYKCERCGKTFPRKYTHKVHMSRFCMKPGEVLSDSTEETWGDAGTGKTLKPNISGKSSEPCHICLKTFRDASTLKRHLLTHSDERPYKCEECDKAFRRKDHLQEHVIVHKLVRPFTCQTCGKSFSRKNGLKTHMIRTTHLLGFDDIVLPSQSKNSAEVQVHVVEHVLAADQLVATSTQVFPENPAESNGSAVGNGDQVASVKDMNEINPQAQVGGETVCSVPLDITNMHSNSENSMETETTVVLSEKQAGPTDFESSEILLEGRTEGTSAQDEESTLSKSSVCPPCGMTFPGKDELLKHFQDHLAENTFACQHCLEIFDSRELFEEHQNTCNDQEYETAIKSDMYSETGENQTINSNIASDEALDNETAEAPVDEDNVPNSRKRKRNDIESPKRADQTCTICDKKFRDNTALKRHSLVHSGERPHCCSQCEKRFRRRDHLKAHETAYHSGKTTHECKTCDAVFNTRYALTVHSKTCKNRPSLPKNPVPDEAKLIGSPESKSCPICHKTFKDPSTQRRHFRIHSDERPFNCSICSKSFRRKDNLKEHLFCHSEEKPFSCKDCGKSLSRRSSLTNHMTVCPARKCGTPSSATVENPIIPEMQFTEPAVQEMTVTSTSDAQDISAAHLIATDMTTTNVTTLSDVTSLDVATSEVAPDVMEESLERGIAEDNGNTFSCEECSKVFRTKWTLKFHQRIHSGEKPYTCTTCDRQFRQPSHLKIHERTHSGERPYHCQICGRAFIDSSTMRRHERLHKNAADPNAIIETQHDVIDEQQDVIDEQRDVNDEQPDVMDNQHDIIKDQEYVISEQHSVINEPSEVIDNMNGNQGNIVQQAVEVNLGDGAIQLLVTTANELASSTQPISTNVVPGMNESDNTQALGTRLDESNIGQLLRECIRNQGIATEKIETLETINWQENQPDEAVGQLIYIQTEESSSTELSESNNCV